LYFNSKSKTKYFKVTVKTQLCVNINILLWQFVLVLLDHLQASIQRILGTISAYHVLWGPIFLTVCTHKIVQNYKKLYIYIKSG